MVEVSLILDSVFYLVRGDDPEFTSVSMCQGKAIPNRDMRMKGSLRVEIVLEPRELRAAHEEVFIIIQGDLHSR